MDQSTLVAYTRAKVPKKSIVQAKLAKLLACMLSTINIGKPFNFAPCRRRYVASLIDVLWRAYAYLRADKFILCRLRKTLVRLCS